MTQNDSRCQGLHWQSAHSPVDPECRPAGGITIQIWNIRVTEDGKPGWYFGRVRILTSIIGAIGVIVAAVIAGVIPLASG